MLCVYFRRTYLRRLQRWMAAFLLDRTQRVKIENNCSYTGHPNGGVPQGTICGPKCFMIYINDLATPVPLYKYVDDSTLFELCEMNSISLMQESVNIAAEWTNNNDMKINSEKSKEMIISFSHGDLGNEVPNILIDGKVVERVDHVKLRGVILSNDLTWKRHVDILNHINLSTLKERRDYLCKKYFRNMLAPSHKVNCLLPEKKTC